MNPQNNLQPQPPAPQAQANPQYQEQSAQAQPPVSSVPPQQYAPPSPQQPVAPQQQVVQQPQQTLNGGPAIGVDINKEKKNIQLMAIGALLLIPVAWSLLGAASWVGAVLGGNAGLKSYNIKYKPGMMLGYSGLAIHTIFIIMIQLA